LARKQLRASNLKAPICAFETARRMGACRLVVAFWQTAELEQPSWALAGMRQRKM